MPLYKSVLHLPRKYYVWFLSPHHEKDAVKLEKALESLSHKFLREYTEALWMMVCLPVLWLFLVHPVIHHSWRQYSELAGPVDWPGTSFLMFLTDFKKKWSGRVVCFSQCACLGVKREASYCIQKKEGIFTTVRTMVYQKTNRFRRTWRRLSTLREGGTDT